MKISFYFLKIFITIAPFIRLGHLAQFYGDMTLDRYLEQFCKMKTPKMEFILIESDLQLNLSLVSATQSSYQNKISCLEMHITNSTSSVDSLQNATVRNRQLKYQKKQLFFNFANFRFDHQSKFKSALVLLSHLHSRCKRCFPFLLLFSLPVRVLVKWIKSAHHHHEGIDQYFQAVVLSTESSQSIHINPVLNGCDFRKKVFMPTNSNHFRQLRTPAEKCNLCQKKINVSVNNVSWDCFVRLKL